jgi:hypothetical protein
MFDSALTLGNRWKNIYGNGGLGSSLLIDIRPEIDVRRNALLGMHEADTKNAWLESGHRIIINNDRNSLTAPIASNCCQSEGNHVQRATHPECGLLTGSTRTTRNMAPQDWTTCQAIPVSGRQVVQPPTLGEADTRSEDKNMPKQQQSRGTDPHPGPIDDQSVAIHWFETLRPEQLRHPRQS